MKIVCIKTRASDDYKNGYKYQYITIGKTYEETSSIQTIGGEGSDSEYYIENDLGKNNWYNTKCFIPLDKWREMQINKII